MPTRHSNQLERGLQSAASKSDYKSGRWMQLIFLDNKKLLTDIRKLWLENNMRPRSAVFYCRLKCSWWTYYQNNFISEPLFQKAKAFCSQVVRHLKFNINVFTSSSTFSCRKEQAELKLLEHWVGTNYKDAFIAQILLLETVKVLCSHWGSRTSEI